MKAAYMETVSLIERLHRQCLEVVKAELDRDGIRDLNNVQALIIFNIGEEELTIGELTHRGYYLGSNVSYNVKKLVENGYLIQERSPHDRRSFHVQAAEKGLKIYRLIDGLFNRHAAQMDETKVTLADLQAANQALRRVEHFWAMPHVLGGRVMSAA